MLCQFSFSNFKSYRDETTLDLQATSAKELSESLIAMENASSLLPTAVLYGPNGGGKSTLLQAFACVTSLIVHPIMALHKTRLDLIVQHEVECVPFLLDDASRSRPTEFRLYFRVNGYEYRYYVSVQYGIISSESLARLKIGGRKPAHIFSRETDSIEIGASIKENVSRSVNPKMPYLSFLAINHDIPEVSVIWTST